MPIVPYIPLIAAGIGAASASKTRKAAQRQADLDRAERSKAKADFDKRIAKYEKSQFVPLDLEALKTENVFEEADLSKDVLPAADYAREQFQQQQANIMQGLKGAAGASGIAGLAQSLSNQAADQSRQTGVTIGQQLTQNRRLALQEKSQKQMQERQIILSNMQGKNQFELDKMATLMGVAGQRTYAAGASLAQQQQNIMNLQAANTQMWASTVQSLGQTMAAGNTGGAPAGTTTTVPSDRRLKKDISLIGKSPSGLNIYSFKYIDKSIGNGTYQGVMSDEVPQEAVGIRNGYDTVNYDMLDVEFKQI